MQLPAGMGSALLSLRNSAAEGRMVLENFQKENLPILPDCWNDPGTASRDFCLMSVMDYGVCIINLRGVLGGF